MKLFVTSNEKTDAKLYKINGVIQLPDYQQGFQQIFLSSQTELKMKLIIKNKPSANRFYPFKIRL